ncbi:hypothetical protein Tco_0670719 [Tanacetum coccineum]
MENSNKGNLPLHHGIKISKDLCLKTDEELDRMSRVPYASAVGSIMYAMTCTRPDVSFALSMVFLLNGGAVTWKSSKQDRVANFTCESKYIAACETSKEAIWMKNFIGDLGVVPTVQDPIKIFCDNESAVALTKEPKDHEKSKHIERKYHFVRRAAWLATLEPDIADYSSATIKFYLDEKFITVTGDKCLSPSQAQFHHFKRLSATDAIAEAYAIHCFSMDTISDATLQLPDTVLNDLANVLQGFTSVFTVLTGLPPSHTQNKSIVLHEGVNAVKVHPYRYPVSQKTQIEIIVAGMLQEVTIKDSFPMPTVEELLDELHGAHFFSKLDLYSEHRLYAKLSKCAFYQQRIEYLGHIVMGVGVEMDPAKVTAVPNWPIPVHIATPCFPWSYSKDATSSTYVSELYAITEAVAKLHHYIFGHYFIIRMDHHSSVTYFIWLDCCLSLPIPNHVWEDSVAMDFITVLPNDCGLLQLIMVVSERLSKDPPFSPLHA